MNAITQYQSHYLRWLLLALGLAANHYVFAEEKGLCDVQVIIPAQYSPSTEAVTVYEGSTNYTTTPVKTGYGERKVKVADAYIEYEIIPAKFKDITETVEIERERVEIETLPATYRTEIKRVKIKDATKRWNPECPPVPATAETGIPANCLIDVPAQYQEVTREIVDIPARTIKKIIPARTKTVTRRIMVEPAKVVRKEIPAVYESIKLTRIEEPAKIVSNRTESRVQNIPSERKIHPEIFRQMPALCEDKLEKNEIILLQQRLQRLGYYQGKPDGVLGSKTRTADTRFQEVNHLASGAITLETLLKLQLR